MPSNTTFHPSVSSSASNANYISPFIHHTHDAHAGTGTMTSLVTTRFAGTKAEKKHTTLSLTTLLLSYPPHWHKQDTSTQTPSSTSKHTCASAPIPLHVPLTYHSTQTPPPTTAAPTQQLAEISPSQEQHHPQNVTHLKT